MHTDKYYGKTLWEWFVAYDEYFENYSFPTMEYRGKPAEKLARMAKEAIETDTPIEIEQSIYIEY